MHRARRFRAGETRVDAARSRPGADHQETPHALAARRTDARSLSGAGPYDYGATDLDESGRHHSWPPDRVDARRGDAGGAARAERRRLPPGGPEPPEDRIPERPRVEGP